MLRNRCTCRAHYPLGIVCSGALFIGSRVCYALPSDLPLRAAPLRFSSVCLHQARQGTLTPKLLIMLGTIGIGGRSLGLNPQNETGE